MKQTLKNIAALLEQGEQSRKKFFTQEHIIELRNCLQTLIDSPPIRDITSPDDDTIFEIEKIVYWLQSVKEKAIVAGNTELQSEVDAFEPIVSKISQESWTHPVSEWWLQTIELECMPKYDKEQMSPITTLLMETPSENKQQPSPLKTTGTLSPLETIAMDIAQEVALVMMASEKAIAAEAAKHQQRIKDVVGSGKMKVGADSLSGQIAEVTRQKNKQLVKPFAGKNTPLLRRYYQRDSVIDNKSAVDDDTSEFAAWKRVTINRLPAILADASDKLSTDILRKDQKPLQHCSAAELSELALQTRRSVEVLLAAEHFYVSNVGNGEQQEIRELEQLSMNSADPKRDAAGAELVRQQHRRDARTAALSRLWQSLTTAADNIDKMPPLTGGLFTPIKLKKLATCYREQARSIENLLQTKAVIDTLHKQPTDDTRPLIRNTSGQRMFRQPVTLPITQPPLPSSRAEQKSEVPDNPETLDPNNTK